MEEDINEWKKDVDLFLNLTADSIEKHTKSITGLSVLFKKMKKRIEDLEERIQEINSKNEK